MTAVLRQPYGRDRAGTSPEGGTPWVECLQARGNGRLQPLDPKGMALPRVQDVPGRLVCVTGQPPTMWAYAASTFLRCGEWCRAMAEMPERAPQESVGNRPEGVLATKLFLPRTPPGFVSRSRLVERLEEGLARALVLVCAPAGFGKTALLADWGRQGQRPVAWLSLDTGDNDPVRFWRHAAAALDRVRPGIAEQVAPLLGQPASFEALVTALINELAAEPGDVLLVLDDYNLVEAQPVHRSLTSLLEHLPPGLHLVLASRSNPPLPLARL